MRQRMAVARIKGEKRRRWNKKSYEWQHSVGDILNSLIKAGLVIQEIGEYPDIWWQYVPEAVQQEDGSYRIPGDRLPQMWSVKAGKT